MAPQRNTGAGAEAELPEYAGHYRLESRLGSGGMGVVHLARSTSGMKLAVKIVHAEFARDPEFRGRFRQEVAAARRVSGAFTASVVDADPEAERPWMATLFIPGPTLSDHVKRNGPMDPAQLRRLMAGLAEALRDIHRVGVVHRDLKPSNVLLADDGPKVIDFGISRPKDSELRTETGKLIGTPPFMAPEQFRRPREVGPAADVFALGSVLVHAATGRGPFDSDSPYVVAYQVVHDEPDLTGVPESLAPLVLRCLAKEPEDRPTPDELMRALRSVAASYDTQAFIPAQRAADVQRSEPVPPQRRLRRRPGRKAAIAAASVLVVAGALASVMLFGDGGDGTTPEDDGSPTPSVSRFSGWAANPVPEGVGAAQCSYGGRQLICARPGAVFGLAPSDGRVLWRHPVATSSTSRPPVLAGGLVQPMADGTQRLEALDPASGKVRWQRKVPAHNAMQVAGGTILLTGPDGTVHAVDAATGDSKWSHRIPGHPLPSFASFAGDPLVYATNPSVDASKTRVTAVDPATGAVRWDVRLDGWLTLVGDQDGSLFFLAADKDYGDTDAVVRYTPSTKSTRRVALPVGRADAQAAVRGNVVHLLGSGGSLEAVDMTTGKRLWHLETAVSRGSVPVSDGTHVFFVAADGRLLAVDAHEGDLVGQTPVRMKAASGRVAGAVPSPLLAQGHLYATAPDGTVFAVDAHNPSAW
ncbi:serine/threonine protein kinase [Streptomyces sp. TLI_55]|uniref:serine/threonine-protein kinase n=1 Tax=Streptomyces sp. TLI_55 TaxID=1938861 RepID=UPI000BC9FC6E|nr:serine/threonine-protein kinase [Streptomyces sp. TLI_55]SNX63072.1 serine/threonine protein kinase [Streptomyces sp. TLI_55]